MSEQIKEFTFREALWIVFWSNWMGFCIHGFIRSVMTAREKLRAGVEG